METSVTPSDKSLLERVEVVEQEIEAATIGSEADAEAFRVRYLGQRSGIVTNLFKQIKEVPPEDRREAGQRLNALKKLAEARLEAARNQLPQGVERSRYARYPLENPAPVSTGPAGFFLYCHEGFRPFDCFSLDKAIDHLTKPWRPP